MMRKRWVRVSVFAAVVVASVGGAAWWVALPEARILAREDHADGSSSVELVSAPYRLDRVYLSMTGPRSNHARIRLSEAAGSDETLWLTGIETEVLAADSFEPVSNEYFCHSNLTLNPETTTPAAHNGSFAAPTHADWRFFTLVPGRTSVHLPPGFGMPVKNRTLLDNFTMALNQNPGHPEQQVRMKTRVWYRAAKPGDGVQPLFRRALYVYQQHVPDKKAAQQAATNVAARPGHKGEECAESCERDQKGKKASMFYLLKKLPGDAHPGATCCVENASAEGVVDQFGKKNTVHWMVPPGEHSYRSEVTQQLDLPAATRVHYVTGHLHPFGRSLTLRDLETGATVLEIRAESRTDALGVEWVSEISSTAGIPLSSDRRYELVTEYNNTAEQPIDAMAILYLYAAEPAVPTLTAQAGN